MDVYIYRIIRFWIRVFMFLIKMKHGRLTMLGIFIVIMQAYFNVIFVIRRKPEYNFLFVFISDSINVCTINLFYKMCRDC